MAGRALLLKDCNKCTNLLGVVHRKASRILNYDKTSYCTFRNLKYKDKLAKANQEHSSLSELIEKYEEKLIYSSVIESRKLKLGFKRNKVVEHMILTNARRMEFARSSVEPLPVSLKYLNKAKSMRTTEEKTNENISILPTVTQFPFENPDKYEENATNTHAKDEVPEVSVKDQILVRKAEYEKNKNWMTDYENYDDSIIEEDERKIWELNYGTPDPKSSVSNIPCGGCGALLHCKDTSIPGYIPSEIYQNHSVKGGQSLKSLICQRCHFLKYYDMALQVRVSPEEYPKILMKINESTRALVVLMVDILDFPCSIWPNIIDIIGSRRPVVIVGNKIDLLPQDSKGYLHRIQNILADSVNISSLSKANIKHVALISAKTGFGVEELITKLHSIWQSKGDVYLIGCTNVGKSTLFNALLQSDYCKVQAVDLVQRATTSPWPGTTLNLLKFPILKPSGWRLYVRHQRLVSLNKLQSQENKLRNIQLKGSNNSKHAMLIGHIERTFTAEEPVAETKDIFSIQAQSNASSKINVGIDETDRIYNTSKWCYDTPGVVHPDQILHLLTTEELMLTLPKQLIQPRMFSLKPGQTIFLAGLGRLDFLEGPVSMRFVVFASENLPITICNTSEADDLYKNFLGTEMFQVPIGNTDRLAKWPNLEAGDVIKRKGIDWDECCADIVLSSAGWISVSCGKNIKFAVKAWTPGKKGIFVRNSLLPNIVTLRGRRIRFSPAYRRTRFYNA